MIIVLLAAVGLGLALEGWHRRAERRRLRDKTDAFLAYLKARKMWAERIRGADVETWPDPPTLGDGGRR